MCTLINTTPNSDRVCQEILFLIFLAYFFLPPYSLSLFYFMISYEGEFRNGKKYAELAYLLLISGNSGVQKRMA